MIDLHTHSSASDGQYTPSELVKKASSKGLSVLALTDHDTVLGLEEAKKAADEAQIKFVPGVELNIEWSTGEFHLLGLGLKHISQSFAEILERLHASRTQRNMEMVQKMNADGVKVTLDDIQNMFPGRTLGRPHFAAYLVEKQIVKNRQTAFIKYLGKGRPWYTDWNGANLDEAVSAIVESGGVPVIAHPLSLYVSWGKIEAVLQDIHERGVEGLEAWHPAAREGECKRLEELARKIGFFITAGSDFHGEAIRSDRKLGHTAGDRKIEDKFFEEELYPHLKDCIF